MHRLPYLAIFLLLIAGCTAHDRLASIDRDVEDLIARREMASLQTEAFDPEATPAPDGSAPDAAYQQQPGTTSPPAEELPVESGEPIDQKTALAAGGLALVPNTMAIFEADEEAATHLDLAKSLGYAIENSPEYKTAKDELFLATLGLVVERHLWGPRFFNTMSATLDGTPEAGDYDQALTLVNEFRVTQRLPYGGSVSAQALVDYVTLLRRSSTTTGESDEQSARAGVSLDLPLLRGAGVVAREDLIQAERDLIYAVRSFERFRREFLVSVSDEYFNLLRRRSQIENQQAQLESLDRLAERFRALADAGREPAFEAERAQQQALFERNNLLNAAESYAAALDSFKIRIGMPTDEPLALQPIDARVADPKLDMTQAVFTAYANRLDFQTSRDQVEDARRQVRVAKNNLLPDLDASADVTLRTRSEEEFGGVEFDLGNSDYRAGLTLDLPLDRQIEAAGYRRSLIRYEQRRRGHRRLRDQVTLQVRRAVRRIEQARFTLELQRRNVQLAERRTVNVRLRERTLGPRDVIEAEQDLVEARNRREQAIADLRSSVLQYLLQTGQMRVDAAGQWVAPEGLEVHLGPAEGEGDAAVPAGADTPELPMPSIDEAGPIEPMEAE